MLFVRPLIMYLVIFSVLMCWNLELVSAATLARTRSQNETNNKTHSLLQLLVRSSVPTPKLLLNILQAQENLSSADQQASVSTKKPLVRSMDSILLHQQPHHRFQHGKPSIMNINLIFGDPSQLTMSTEAPSTTTAKYDHYATTQRSNLKKRSITDDFYSEWSMDDEEEEEEADGTEDEAIDYDELDFSQPDHQQLAVDESVDLSVRSTNGMNQNDYLNRFEEGEEDKDEDIILVIAPITTSKPITKNFDQKNVPIEQKSLTQIGLNEWPVQIGLQARTKQRINTVTKLVNSQMGNGNRLQTNIETQKFNDQQSGNKMKGNPERLDFNQNNENIADSHEGSSIPFTVHSQFMNSPASASRQINKTKPQETSIEPFEIVDRIMLNHYGNPRQNNPTVSYTLPIPDLLRDIWYASSEEEKYQKPTTTTAEPDEAFYYNNSEEETDQDLYLDYPEEKEDDTKQNWDAEIINNSETITRRPSTTSLRRGPFFVSSAKLEPIHQTIDVSDEIGMMLNPIAVVDRKMDLNANSGINFVKPPDFIDPSAFFTQFPSDPIVPNRPSLNLNPHQEQQKSPMANLPVAGKTKHFQDNFVVNSDHVQPIVQFPNIKTELNSDSYGLVKAREPTVSVMQREIITQKPIEFNNAKNLYVERDTPTTRLDRLPYPVMTSPSTDDDIIVTFTPSPTRPFIQSPYVTWATTKAKSGPYFVNSAEKDPRQSGVYYTGQGMRKKANETIHNLTGIISNTDVAGRTKSTSVSQGRPPYFVSSTPTPLFQSTHSRESTRKPTDIIKNYQNVSNNQQATTTIRPEGTKENYKNENNFVTSGLIRPSPHSQPPYLNVARSNNTVRPIELTVSSSESDTMNQKLDIDMKESVGIISNRIGISNKNNVFVVPKTTAASNAQMQNNSFPAGLFKKVPEQSNMNMSNQQHTNTAMIVNHEMGSFVITSPPIQSPAQRIVTHPSASTESSTTTTIATVVPRNEFKPKGLENTSHTLEKDHTMQEDLKKPIVGIVQNPIGISNKNNVFVVPKSASAIARSSILSNPFPVDLLMKRHGLSIDHEKPILRPFERIVNHQMGSFVVTAKSDDDAQIRLDITTAASIEESSFSGTEESIQQIDISNSETEETTKPLIEVIKNSTEIVNPNTDDKSAVSASAGPGRAPYFSKSSTAPPFQPIYLNQHSMSKLVEEIAKFQRVSGNLKGSVDPSADVAQPSLRSFRTGQFMKSIVNKNNSQQQQMARMNRRQVGMIESRSNSLNVTVSPNISRQSVNLPSNYRTPKNPATTKSSKRQKTTDRS